MQLLPRNWRSMILVAALAVVALLLLAACGNGGAADEEDPEEGQEYNFQLAETHPEDHPTTQADMRFAELVSERTGDRITIEVYPNSQLGEEQPVLEQVQGGSIEFTRVSASPLAEFVDDVGVFNLPYIFESGDHMWRFLESEDGQALLDSLQDGNMQGLAYYDSGARNFYTTDRAVESPEDMQGLQIRVQRSAINIALMEALGASATPMDFGEVYSALQTGAIDGAENNWPSYLTTSHYEVAPNFTLNEHTRVPEILLISQTTWESLNEQDQEIIRDAAQESVQTQRELWAQAEEEAEEEIRAAGNNIIEIDDLTPWQEAAQPIIEDHRDQYGETLDAIEAHAEE